MGLPVNFVKNLPKIKAIINNYHLHEDATKQVNIDYLLEALKIEVREKVFDDYLLEGLAPKVLSKSNRPVIFINQEKPLIVKRKIKGHELYHILFHGKELPLNSRFGHHDKILEREANLGAAYFLIPAKTIYLAGKYKIWHFELAEQMGVQLEVVQRRYEIYLDRKEYENFSK